MIVEVIPMDGAEPTTPSACETADLTRLPPAARALVIHLVETIGEAEARARAAEEATAAAMQRAKAAEEAAQAARKNEVAAVTALEHERRGHADHLAGIVAARAALDAAINRALGADAPTTETTGNLATDGTCEKSIAANGLSEIVVDAVSETVCAEMIDAGEARDRADAIAILVAEAAASRRRLPTRPRRRPDTAPPH